MNETTPPDSRRRRNGPHPTRGHAERDPTGARRQAMYRERYRRMAAALERIRDEVTRAADAKEIAIEALRMPQMDTD